MLSGSRCEQRTCGLRQQLMHWRVKTPTLLLTALAVRN
eukprot:COSAG06_NODE_322_length_17565_cov_152.607752_8_plen_38_part_00